MLTFLKYFQLIVSVLLILAILMQNKTAGLSGAMSSTPTSFQSTRRGAEKVIFNATIVLTVLFVLGAVAFIFVA